MFYKYLTKQNRPKHKSATHNRPAGPAPDLNYFRNKVSQLLKLVSTYMYFSSSMLGYSSNILGVSIFFCRSIVLFHILKTKSFLYIHIKN